VDGMNLMAVIDADTAVQKWEVLENLIYWFAIPIVLAHSMFDAELYRDQRDWRMERDPIPTFKITCWSKMDYHRWNHSFEQKIEAKVQLAVDFAEAETGR
jgi:hypothetical protein